MRGGEIGVDIQPDTLIPALPDHVPQISGASAYRPMLAHHEYAGKGDVWPTLGVCGEGVDLHEKRGVQSSPCSSLILRVDIQELL